MIRRSGFKMALGAFVFAAGAMALAAALQSGRTPVILCHRAPGNPPIRQTITVDAAAVAVHLKHGDTLGACNASPSR